MKNSITQLLMFTLFFLPTFLPTLVVQADDRPYGAGGCGLGSIIMGKDGNQVIAITSNETGTQSFGITSGTSNCVDSGVVKLNKQVRAFIEVNQQQLASDLAKGGGETISSLSHLYECKDHNALGSALQRHYRKIFPSESTSPAHIEATIRAVIMVEFKESCLS